MPIADRFTIHIANESDLAIAAELGDRARVAIEALLARLERDFKRARLFSAVLARS